MELLESTIAFMEGGESYLDILQFMLPRLIAAFLLNAFLLVAGASAVHAHKTVINAPIAIGAGVDHDDDGGCSFCSAVKCCAAVVDNIEDNVPLRKVTGHEALLAQSIYDRCPLQAAGRAPPVVG